MSDHGVPIARFVGEFGGEQQCPRLESRVSLRVKRLRRPLGEEPRGPSFTAEQLDDGQVEQSARHARPVADSLPAIKGHPGEPAPLVELARRGGQEAEVGEGEVLAASIAKLLAQAERLSEVLVRWVEQAPIPFDTPQVVEGERLPGRVLNLRERVDRALCGVEGGVQISR